MKTRIVGSGEIAAQPGRPLDAEFWTGQRGGETREAWQRRQDAGEQLRVAARHLDLAQAAMARARELTGTEDP